MPSLRFLQLSDLHLDSSLRSGLLGLDEEKARVRRRELREILPRACDLARERGVEIVLIPGDLFDDESVTQDTVNYAIDHLAGLSPVPVVIAPGNHDFYSLGSPYSGELLEARKQRSWPGNVHIFRDGTWSTIEIIPGSGVHVTGMAHSANALFADRLLSRPVPRAVSDRGLDILIFHGSLDNVGIPSRKLRTLPFSESELASQGFDYAAVGHYHEQRDLHDAAGRIIGAYAGCPAGRGLDEIGEKFVIVGRIDGTGSESRVAIEKIRLDTRVIRRVDVGCQGVTHRDALLQRIESSLAAEPISREDLVHIRLVGRIAPGIDRSIPDALLEGRFFHASFDTSRLEPDYDLDRYMDESLRTTEARFVREMKRRIDRETDAGKRRLLENALHYGLDALIQGEVSPRYED